LRCKNCLEKQDSLLEKKGETGRFWSVTKKEIVTIFDLKMYGCGGSRKEAHFILILFASVILVCLPVWSWAYNLSADTVLSEEGEKQEGKIYIKGDKYRIERQGESDYIILRHDRNLMWVVVPAEKVYVELPLDEKKTPKITEKNPNETSRKLIGTETLEGHPTEKYLITVKEGSKTESFYQWTATDLNFPLKTSAVEGEWSVEFRNVKKNVPDNVFEIPEGYEKAKIVVKPGPEGQKSKAAPKK
jgi:outer membrane lipoprotein-sorting protein